MLCSLGVFNAPLMNDAIFKFKRYEDASLTYTGIDKHSNDEVGGWDTTIRKTQYEKLFYNQQSSMSDVDFTAYRPRVDAVPAERPNQKTAKSQENKNTHPQPSAPQSPAPPVSQENIDQLLAVVEVETTVSHKKFGNGKVVKINKNEKFIFVKFFEGEKKFLHPDAFLRGFLQVIG